MTATYTTRTDRARRTNWCFWTLPLRTGAAYTTLQRTTCTNYYPLRTGAATAHGRSLHYYTSTTARDHS